VTPEQCHGLQQGRTKPPGICQVGRLVLRPARLPTLNVEVGQTTHLVYRGMARMERREGSEGQSHTAEEREIWIGTGDGTTGRETLSNEGGLYLDIRSRATEFLVTPLLMGPVCQGRFEEPVRSWTGGM